MFVPYGIAAKEGFSVELENIISDVWPCDFGKLQANIEEGLKRSLVPHVNYDPLRYSRTNYPSYNNSKAKSVSAFVSEYVNIRVETDLAKGYGKEEAERIKVTAKASPLETTYHLTGTYHLIEGHMEVAQMVLDIFEACEKLRG